MSLEHTLLLILFVAVAAGTPGPANLALIASGAQNGIRASVPFLVGTLVGFQAIFWLAACGALAVVASFPMLWTGLRYACMAYILYLAWHIAVAKITPDQRDRNAPGFWRGAILHPLNPKAYAMQFAALAQFASPTHGIRDAVILSLLFLCLGGVLNAGWMCSGEFIRRLASRPTTFRAISIVLALLMAGSTLASLQLA